MPRRSSSSPARASRPRPCPSGRTSPTTPGLWPASPTIDASEVEALTGCVRAFLLYYPGRSVRVHIPWCENDYQIDVGTPEGVEEYKRIMDRAAELGVTHLLYTPGQQRALAARGQRRRLGLGERPLVRAGPEDPERGVGPAARRRPGRPQGHARLRRLEEPQAHGLRLSVPALPPGSASGPPGPEAGRRLRRRRHRACAASRTGGWTSSRASCRATGAAGFSFDHWWIAYGQGLEQVRPVVRLPAASWRACAGEAFDVVVDGRQQYQSFGPWTWLAGSYPHPTLTDEQPESFKAFPDLHTDRVSADRQRFAAWTYRVERFAPPEIMPGFITHQSERNDEKGVMRRDRFRPKDWDSARLEVLAAVLDRHGALPPRRQLHPGPGRRGVRGTVRTRTRPGSASGSTGPTRTRATSTPCGRSSDRPWPAASTARPPIVEDRGIVFLFNPNPGRKEARFKLDASIGLVKGGPFMIKELYPVEGRLVGLGRGALDAAAARPSWLDRRAARPPSSRSSPRRRRSRSPSCSTSRAPSRAPARAASS
ncbi:MAG: hypothetical protein MZU79_04450 [Anaerotruncus sp.]|nr:hypothetical protein [Anaerotruncus sp.]